MDELGDGKDGVLSVGTRRCARMIIAPAAPRIRPTNVAANHCWDRHSNSLADKDRALLDMKLEKCARTGGGDNWRILATQRSDINADIRHMFAERAAGITAAQAIEHVVR